VSRTIWVSGPTYLIWRVSARLSGIVLWGQPEPRHAANLTRLLTMDAAYREQLSLIDVRRVESVDPVTFDLLAAYVCLRSESLRQRISAQALVRPGGLVGVVAAGFYRVVEHVYPVEVFTNPCEGLNWLGVGELSSFLTEIDGVIESCASASSVLRGLRAHLRRERGNANLATAASVLGLSARALQRKLRDACTSFQTEQNAAQIYVAKRLLRERDYDIKRIAFEVGCSSAAAFSVLFRKFEGESPSAWRRSQPRTEFESTQYGMGASTIYAPNV